MLLYRKIVGEFRKVHLAMTVSFAVLFYIWKIDYLNVLMVNKVNFQALAHFFCVYSVVERLCSSGTGG